MSEIVCILAGLTFLLPAAFVQVDNSVQTHMLNPDLNLTCKETFASYGGPNGEKVYVFVWEPYPPKPGGPMAATRQWDRIVAGEKIKVTETDQFMGKKQKVFVVHLKRSSPDAVIMIYASGVTFDFFDKLISSIKYTGSQ